MQYNLLVGSDPDFLLKRFICYRLSILVLKHMHKATNTVVKLILTNQTSRLIEFKDNLETTYSKYLISEMTS